MKITKTEWEYAAEPTCPAVTGIDNGNCRITVAVPYGKDVEERDAIGNLIAAAPKMYKFVEKMAMRLAACQAPGLKQYSREAKKMLTAIEQVGRQG